MALLEEQLDSAEATWHTSILMEVKNIGEKHRSVLGKVSITVLSVVYYGAWFRFFVMRGN